MDKDGAVPTGEDLGKLRQEAMESVGLGLYRLNFDGTILQIDRAALRMADLEERYPDPAMVIGKKIEELIEYTGDPGTLRRAVLEQGRVQGLEYPFRTLSGEDRWARHDSYVAKDPVTGEDYVQAIVLDITARKRAELGQARSQAEIGALLEAARDAIYAFDRDCIYLFANLIAARSLGLKTAEELVGRRMQDFFQPEDAERQLNSVQSVFESGQVYTAPARATLIGDVERWYSTVLSPVIDAAGQIQSVLGISRDVTALRQAERERARMAERMQHAQKLESLGVLSGGIAHDFNNLLVAVLGNADLALMDLAPESPARLAVEQIRTAAVRASDLTNQLLAYSGRGRFHVRPLSLNRMVEEMVHLLKVSVPKRAVIQFDLAPDLPAVEADAAQLQQIILNLVTNAAEAIGDDDGVVRLRTGTLVADATYLASTYLTEELHEGRYAFLEVTDSGIGMEPETLERIFDPFFTTKVTGRGLGLAAVLGIVRSHAGAIKVYSEPGQGTTFKVLLPASEGQTAKAADPHAASRQYRGSGTILVVDDEQTVLQVARDLLVRFGFEVELAGDGQQALEVVERRGDDLRLVLLDMTMPRLDGEQTYAGIRRLSADLPVVLCSGYSEADATSRFKGKGLAGFLQKPFEISRLVTLLRDILGE